MSTQLSSSQSGVLWLIRKHACPAHTSLFNFVIDTGRKLVSSRVLLCLCQLWFVTGFPELTHTHTHTHSSLFLQLKLLWQTGNAWKEKSINLLCVLSPDARMCLDLQLHSHQFLPQWRGGMVVMQFSGAPLLDMQLQPREHLCSVWGLLEVLICRNLTFTALKSELTLEFRL